MSDLWQDDAATLAGRLASGEASAPEIAAAFLDRIDAVNPAVNAIVALRERDAIMDDARRLQESGPHGPLFGLPIAIKDLAETEGIATTHGSPRLAGHIPDADCRMVAAIRDAGALIVGKTNTPEWGLGSHTKNPVYGATLNPYAPGRSCGGSSGGAAVALATRMLPVADGSDMMGSLRNPAAWNNVYGFRPSYGVVPDEPTGDSFLHQLATAGPMARTPRDLWRLLAVQASPPRGVHFEPIGAPEFDDFDPRGVTIGWLGDWEGYLPMEDGVLALCEASLAIFTQMGCRVVALPPPFPPERIWEAWITLRSWAVAAKLRDIYESTPELLNRQAVWEIERGLGLSAMAVHDASVIRSEWNRAFHALDAVDACLLPSAQIFPFDVTLDWPETVAGREMDTYHRWMEVVIPVSILGIPAVALPAGFSPAGLPMGVQLFSRRGSDAWLLAMADAYHTRTGWPQTRPPAPG